MPDTVFPYDDEVADPYAGDDTKNPHEEDGEPDEGEEEAAEEDGAAPPPKRGPGRPKKAA